MAPASYAKDVWTYVVDIDGMDVYINSPEPLSEEAAYQAAFNVAQFYIHGLRPGGGTTPSAHEYVEITVTTIDHKHYVEAPRCIEYVLLIGVCKECGKTYKRTIDENRIYCCGSDTESPFDDVPLNSWYYDSVCGCSSRGYMSGTSARTFSPGASLTRAMFALILAKIDGADLTKYTGSTGFKDVPAGKWYSAAVKWEYENGYTSGIGGGLFGINKPVTREQLAVFLHSYTQKKGYSTARPADLSEYYDKGSISSWAVAGMRWAVSAGLISGATSKPNGTWQTNLMPKKSATRAEVAVIVMKYVNNVKGK